MSFVVIDNKRAAIVNRIRIDKNIVYIAYLKSVFKSQIRKIKYNIKLYTFVVLS